MEGAYVFEELDDTLCRDGASLLEPPPDLLPTELDSLLEPNGLLSSVAEIGHSGFRVGQDAAHLWLWIPLSELFEREGVARGTRGRDDQVHALEVSRLGLERDPHATAAGESQGRWSARRMG